MKDFIKLVLIGALLGFEVLPSLVTIGLEAQKMTSSLYSYYENQAERTLVEQCQKIMDTALDEIDFLQDFKEKQIVIRFSGTEFNRTTKLSNTSGIELHYGHDDIEKVSWHVQVLKDQKIRFSFLGWNWPTDQIIHFEDRSPSTLKHLPKLRIKTLKDLEIQAFKKFDKAFGRLFDPFFNLWICAIIFYMLKTEVKAVHEQLWFTLPMFQLWLIIALQGWCRMVLRRNIPNRRRLTDFEVAFGWFNYKWACFYYMIFCHRK